MHWLLFAFLLSSHLGVARAPERDLAWSEETDVELLKHQKRKKVEVKKERHHIRKLDDAELEVLEGEEMILNPREL